MMVNIGIFIKWGFLLFDTTYDAANCVVEWKKNICDKNKPVLFTIFI